MKCSYKVFERRWILKKQTNQNDFFQRYSNYEDGLMTRFHELPFFQEFPRMSNRVLIQFLLQLGHLSAEFIPWYEKAKQGFESEEAKEVVRRILRDEIPVDAPTHQDDRLHDLKLLGISKEKILNTPALPQTRIVIRKMYALSRYPQTEYELKVLVTLRIFGEILVSETYQYIVTALEQRFGIIPTQSHFYAPHCYHDRKGEIEKNHTTSFDTLLNKLIVDERTLQTAQKVASRAFRLRSSFYGQFRRKYP